jgi:hypothetical protein
VIDSFLQLTRHLPGRRLGGYFFYAHKESTWLQKIFRATQRYGLIVADNGSSGTYDTRWNNDALNPAFRVADGERLRGHHARCSTARRVDHPAHPRSLSHDEPAHPMLFGCNPKSRVEARAPGTAQLRDVPRSARRTNPPLEAVTCEHPQQEPP